MNEPRGQRNHGYDFGWKAKIILAPILAAAAISEAVKSGIRKIKGIKKK